MSILQQLSEQLAQDGEQCVRESRQLDYAWLKDQRELLQGREPHFMDDLIDRQFATLWEEGNVEQPVPTNGPNP